MTDAERQLFDYAAGFVTPADVAAFSFPDPGYPGYVAAFTRILSTGQLPDRPSFDVSESVALTRWTDADGLADAVRFRRYRVLTSVVGLVQLRAGVEPSDVLPPNYAVVSLLNDAVRLSDQSLARLARPVFERFADALADDTPEEAPFAVLGVLLADAYAGADVQLLSDLAEALIEAERRPAGRSSGDFLFGCTHFDQLNGLWVWLVDRLLPPATPTLRLVRDAIAGSGPLALTGAR